MALQRPLLTKSRPFLQERFSNVIIYILLSNVLKVIIYNIQFIRNQHCDRFCKFFVLNIMVDLYGRYMICVQTSNIYFKV